MPIIKSAIKRVRQTAKRRARNITTKRSLKGAVKAFLLKPTSAGLQAAQSELDTAVKKNILPKNTASRRKSQLSRVAKDAGVKATAKKTAPVKAAAKSAGQQTAAKPTAKTTVAKTATKLAAKKPATVKSAGQRTTKK